MDIFIFQVVCLIDANDRSICLWKPPIDSQRLVFKHYKIAHELDVCSTVYNHDGETCFWSSAMCQFVDLARKDCKSTISAILEAQDLLARAFFSAPTP